MHEDDHMGAPGYMYSSTCIVILQLSNDQLTQSL